MKFIILAVGLTLSILQVSARADQDSLDLQTSTTSETYVFLDTTLPLDKRVDDLVSRLTTTEKIAQMFNNTPAIERLGIPAYNWWNEALHGVARAGEATVFPQAIGLAATFNEDLMYRVATAISDEGRAKYNDFMDNDVNTMYGGLTFWSPNINIFRDPRWGRGQETYGEDPFLTGRMAVNFVRGLQGNHKHYLKTIATVKHYAVHSGPEKTRHSDDYHPSARDLYETYLPAFQTTISEASVASLMCAYNAVNGTPACANSLLMKDLLRKQMGFDGYVVSDCGAIADFYDNTSHDFVDSPAEAAALAVRNGTDLNCGDHHGNTYTNLHSALRQGFITEAEIDISVKRLFTARMRLGMFDPQTQVPFSELSINTVGSPEHIKLSQQAAEQSLVLLKNDGLLPLNSGIKVAVIGPNATNPGVLVANYHGKPTQAVTPLQGIINRLGKENVHYAPGSAKIAEIYAHHHPVESKVLFHQDQNGQIQSGLQAHYIQGRFRGDDLWKNDFKDIQPVNPLTSMQRVDSNIDFKWNSSPIDQTIEQEFAVQWTGFIQPEQSGQYDFSGSTSLKIDGQLINAPIYLEAGKRYALDARFSIYRQWHSNALAPSALLSWLNTSTDLTKEALSAAGKADVVIFIGGIDARLEGEEMPLELDGFSGGDRTHIRLPETQTELLKKLKKTGKPIVLVNVSGSAMALNWHNSHLNALIQAFYPGEKTGTALANVLWGDVNPSGRLPITFYKSIKDLPEFNDYSMDNRTYKYHRQKPLYPFGHGLSYSQFSYGDMDTPQYHKPNRPLIISAKVTNASDRNGDEVSQLYLSLLDIPGTPIRSLKGFKHTSLAAGQEYELEFTLNPDDLKYVDQDGELRPYQGRVLATIGSGQEGYVSPRALVKKTITFK